MVWGLCVPLVPLCASPGCYSCCSCCPVFITAKVAVYVNKGSHNPAIAWAQVSLDKAPNNVHQQVPTGWGVSALPPPPMRAPIHKNPQPHLSLLPHSLNLCSLTVGLINLSFLSLRSLMHHLVLSGFLSE